MKSINYIEEKHQKKIAERMVKAVIGASLAVFCLSTSSCLTVNEKMIIDPPYKPAVSSTSSNAESAEGQIVNLYYSKDDIPAIDGSFSEWEGLEGVMCRTMVYGGIFDPENTDGRFVVRTDGTTLYVFADITDNDPRPNTLPGPQAWRGDSIEVFFGTDTSRHSFYKPSDKRLRIIPKSTSSIRAVDVCIDDVVSESSDIKTAAVFTEKGYRIEFSIPLSLLNTQKLSVKQNVRMEFQINDADDGKERTRLLHWMSRKDASYMDAGTWGDGKVVPLSLKKPVKNASASQDSQNAKTAQDAPKGDSK